MRSKPLKVAVLHDWLVGFRGGERILEAFCEIYPDADIYTLLHKKGSVPESIERHKIHVSFLDKIPGIYENYRKFLPLFPLAVDRMAFCDSYDLIISSTHCVIKGMGKTPGALHVSYVHTPMRYMYDQFDMYFGEHAPLYQQLGARLFRPYLTKWDKNSNANVDHMISNSRFVRERIAAVYNRTAEVIHPFVDLKDFDHLDLKKKSAGDYYLMVSAFAPNKRVDLAIEAFNQNGKKLVIVGSGQQEQELRANANSNVEFLGACDRQAIVDLYFKAKGFIFPGIEDFGITPLESLAAGTPLIAFRRGGVLETNTEDTAEFFDDQSSAALVAAIERFERRQFDPLKLRHHAENFSKQRFIAEIGQFIDRKLQLNS